jgi:hypothetical protein
MMHALGFILGKSPSPSVPKQNFLFLLRKVEANVEALIET